MRFVFDIPTLFLSTELFLEIKWLKFWLVIYTEAFILLIELLGDLLPFRGVTWQPTVRLLFEERELCERTNGVI